ncbi:MAG: flavin reductase family protein, partial [Leeuwenhoekiella sp.]
MLTIDPKDLPTAKLYGYLVSSIGPRPIAFASTVDAEGNPNLSPFSFFNVFSANPPVLIFSCARRVLNNTVKDTFENVVETKEVVINIVNYSMVQQMSLTSTEFEKGVDEFVKAGFTKVKSDYVKPFRVKESPVQIECKLREVIILGEEGGAGNLILCDVVKMHIDESILDDDKKIDQHRIDQVARLGGDWYTRANQGLFEVPRPAKNIGIGVDQIPDEIRLSSILTRNDLGKLGNVENLPGSTEIRSFIAENRTFSEMVQAGDRARIHRL